MQVNNTRAKVFWCCQPQCENLLEVYNDGADSCQCSLHERGSERGSAFNDVYCPRCQHRRRCHCLHSPVLGAMQDDVCCLHMTCPCGHQYYRCCDRDYLDRAAANAHSRHRPQCGDRLERGDWT